MPTRSLLFGAALVALCAAPALAQLPDAHFINPQNEYFVANEEYASGWQYVTLAQMLRPASDETRGEAQFLAIGPSPNHQAGSRFWARYYWRTRIAAPSEVSVGKMVFCVDLQGEGGAYRAPTSRSEATQTTWFVSTITDTSDLYKQEAQAGDFKLNINCVRVAQ